MGTLAPPDLRGVPSKHKHLVHQAEKRRNVPASDREGAPLDSLSGCFPENIVGLILHDLLAAQIRGSAGHARRDAPLVATRWI
jgi:hypothetical protein